MRPAFRIASICLARGRLRVVCYPVPVHERHVAEKHGESADIDQKDFHRLASVGSPHRNWVRVQHRQETQNRPVTPSLSRCKLFRASTRTVRRIAARGDRKFEQIHVARKV